MAWRWQSPSSRVLVRHTIALSCAISVTFCFGLDWRGTVVEAHRLDPPLFLAFLRDHLAVRTALLAVSLLSLWQFARRGWLLAGLLALLCDGLIFEAHATRFGRVEAEALCADPTLLGWLLGAWFARQALPKPQPQNPVLLNLNLMENEVAFSGALALFSGTYVAAGLSKLLRSGPEWMVPETIWSLVLTNQRTTSGLGHALSQLVLHSPFLATVLAILTVVLEAGAWIALLGPRLRALAMLQIFGFHSVLWLMCGLNSSQGMLLACAFGLPWPELVRRWRTEAETPTLHLSVRSPLLRLLAGLLVLILLAWFSPLRPWFAVSPRAALRVWELPPTTVPHIVPPQKGQEHPELAPLTPAEKLLLGDLPVGTQLAEFQIRAIGHLPGQDVHVAVDIGDGFDTARLEIALPEPGKLPPVLAGPYGITVNRLMSPLGKDAHEPAEALGKRLPQQ